MLTVIALAVLAGTAQETTSESLQPRPVLSLSVETPKGLYALYEDVTVVYRVENSVSNPVRGPVCTDQACMQVVVADADGNTATIPQNRECTGIRFGERHPGYRRVSELDVHAATFSKPGTYTLVLRLWVGGDPDPVFVDSNSVLVTVSQPTGADADAIAYFQSLDDFHRLLYEGSWVYCRGRNGPGCFEEINAFLVRHSASAYAPRITRDLAEAVATGLIEVTPRHDLAVGLFTRFLERWPDHPHASTVMYRLALVLDDAGHHQDAVAVARQFAERFPDATEKQSWLNGHLTLLAAPEPNPAYDGKLAEEPE